MKRILTFSAAAAVMICAIVLSLSVLDIISVPELRHTLGRSLTVVGVGTVAIVVMAALLRLGHRSTDRKQQPNT